jgi:hypothetical protein
MTINDLCPGFDRQPLSSQLTEVLRRARACHANVEIIADPRLIGKLGDYLDLGIEIADKMAGAGSLSPSCHELRNPAPVSPEEAA